MEVPRGCKTVQFFSLFLFLLQFQNGHGFLSQIAARLPLKGTPAAPGSPWPLPRSWTKSDTVATLSAKEDFKYSANVQDCDILNAALERYNYDLLTQNSPVPISTGESLPVLSQVLVQISEDSSENLCSTYPKLNKDINYEFYNLTVGLSTSDSTTAPSAEAVAQITAKTVWGALRALETFSQLVWRDRDWNAHHFYINLTTISDFPRYPHRGLMIDTARHYLSPKTIEQVLNAMSYNKLNVLHWHVVDDQSFPFESSTFPELANKGAYIPGVLVFSPSTVQSIIEKARLRGIRVVLEFDTPGHTLGFGKSHPELLTPCYGDGINAGTPNYPNHAAYEILDPTRETTYIFMSQFFAEVFKNVTKDEYVHLGMDEVYYSCWQSSPLIKAFMLLNNYTEYSQVLQHYAERHLEMIRQLGAKAIIWNDPLDYGVHLNSDVVVQVWKGDENTWPEYFQKSLSMGYSSILSSCWYLNYVAYGETWKKYYECDPELSFETPLPDWQKELILGGEAAMWGEYTDPTNVVAKLFPYAGAVAEKLWSTPNSSTTDDAMWRLDEHRCRLLARGLQAQPIFNGYCSPQELD